MVVSIHAVIKLWENFQAYEFQLLVETQITIKPFLIFNSKIRGAVIRVLGLSVILNMLLIFRFFEPSDSYEEESVFSIFRYFFFFVPASNSH